MKKIKSTSISDPYNDETRFLLPPLPVVCAGDNPLWGENVWSTDEDLSPCSLLSFNDADTFSRLSLISDTPVGVDAAGGSDAWLADNLDNESSMRHKNLSGEAWLAEHNLQFPVELKMEVVRQFWEIQFPNIRFPYLDMVFLQQLNFAAASMIFPLATWPSLQFWSKN